MVTLLVGAALYIVTLAVWLVAATHHVDVTVMVGIASPILGALLLAPAAISHYRDGQEGIMEPRHSPPD